VNVPGAAPRISASSSKPLRRARLLIARLLIWIAKALRL
jgi:hypothetical protein